MEEDYQLCFFMDKIYECEDKIEEAKFLLSALKIQTAFINILRVAERKKINYQRTFIDQLQRQYSFQILYKCQAVVQDLCEIYEKIKLRLVRRTFQQILHFSQRDIRRSGKDRSGDPKEDHFDGKMAAISVINEEDWRDKLTNQELQMHCRYYRDKIQQVEKSFADFFKVIKKE